MKLPEDHLNIPDLTRRTTSTPSPGYDPFKLRKALLQLMQFVICTKEADAAMTQAYAALNMPEEDLATALIHDQIAGTEP